MHGTVSLKLVSDVGNCAYYCFLISVMPCIWDLPTFRGTYIFGVVISPTPFKMETISGYLQALTQQAVRRCIPENNNHHTQISAQCRK